LAFGKKHAATATRQHAENAKDNGADEIPTHSPRHGGQDAMVLLTFLQRLARSCGGARAPHAMVKKSPRARRCRSAPSPPFGERGPRCRLSRCAAPISIVRHGAARPRRPEYAIWGFAYLNGELDGHRVVSCSQTR